MPDRTSTARINLRPGLGPDVAVVINGQELKNSARAVTIRGDVDSFPTVEVELYIDTVEVDVDGLVRVSDANHALLVAIGWTPPPGPDSEP